MSKLSPSQQLYQSAIFLLIPKICQKAENLLHLYFKDRHSVCWIYQLYLINMTEKVATSYQKKVDKVENQNLWKPVHFFFQLN
jgi:hypothetical protein